MALYVMIEGNHTIEWHVGEGALRGKVPINCEILAVAADGDELDKVQIEIDGIRKAMKKRVVTWLGEDARFIVNNL